MACLRQVAFRGFHHVGQQHGAGHRAHSPGVRGEPGGDVGRGGVHVPGDHSLAGAVVDAADADVEHDGARLEVLRLDHVRLAGRGDHDVGLPEFGGQVHRAGVGQDDRGVDVLAGQQQPHRAADGDAAAHHQHALAVEADAVPGEQLHAALGGARQRGLHGAADVGHEPAQVHRVQAVGVLVGVHGLQDDVLVDVLGQRQLDDVAGAVRVLVELPDHGQQLLLGGVLRQVAADGRDAHLGAVLVLAADVPGAARVGADQDGAQARDDALGLQCGDAFGQFGLDGGGGGLAVKDLGGFGVSWSQQTSWPTTARAAGTAGSRRRACPRGTGAPRRPWRSRPSARWR